MSISPTLRNLDLPSSVIKEIGPYTSFALEGELINFDYFIEPYARPNSPSQMHVYLKVVNYSACDRTGGNYSHYVDIEECNNNSSWKKALENYKKQFNYLGPSLIALTKKIVSEKLAWEQISAEDIFAPKSVQKKFYADIIKDNLENWEEGIRKKIFEIVHRHLLPTRYDIYYEMGEIRIFGKSFPPTFDDIDDLQLDKIQKLAWKAIRNAGNELFTLYNFDRKKHNLNRLTAGPLSTKASNDYADIRIVSEKSENKQKNIEIFEKFPKVKKISLKDIVLKVISLNRTGYRFDCESIHTKATNSDISSNSFPLGNTFEPTPSSPLFPNFDDIKINFIDSDSPVIRIDSPIYQEFDSSLNDDTTPITTQLQTQLFQDRPSGFYISDFTKHLKK